MFYILPNVKSSLELLIPSIYALSNSPFDDYLKFYILG